MKISVSWLKTLIPVAHSVQELSELLTSAGLEVEGTEAVETIRGGLKGLVVGEVLTCAKHPDADRLSVTTVDVGNGTPLHIVCGASNVAAGQKVIVATPGTTLYPASGDPFVIKKSKIRGAPSEGMICAEDEIGVGTSHEGIMVLPADTRTGMPASEYFKCETDTVLEIGLTPNRNDAASHLGVARDLAAVLNTAQHDRKYTVHIDGVGELPEAAEEAGLKISVQVPAACPRYSGILLTNVRVGESPDWLKNRLRAIGLRPLNNIVDITNFVLHELGQPLHAFDADKITGRQVIVRMASEGESFHSLDGAERKLRNTDLVICNEKSVMCLAGIFGGSESGVTQATTSVFIESACFDATTVRRSSKHHALKTDASYRFERGTDPEMTVTALKRAAHLIMDLAGGTVASAVYDLYPEKLEPYKVAFSYKNCNDLIGKDVDRGLIRNIIQQLDIEIDSEGSDGLLLKVPRYRNDVTREADVIEEVMRIYGFDHVEASRHISWTGFHAPVNNRLLVENRVAAILEATGFHEIMCLSLNSEAAAGTDGRAVKVLNPLSADLNTLRTSLLSGGLQTIAYNVNRKSNALRFFESGKVYSRAEGSEGYIETAQLALFVTGPVFAENPYGMKQSADFAYLKGVVDAILAKTGISKVKISPIENDPAFAYGLNLALNKRTLGRIGLVSREQLRLADVQQPVFYAYLDWELLVSAFAKQKVEYEELSRFPSVRRDLALLIDRKVSFAQLEELAYATEKKFLREVNIFDVYEDEKLGNKKSYALSFTLEDKEATLTDKQIDGVMQKLMQAYRDKIGAELR